MPAYLKLGDLKGNVTEANHQQWIELDSVQWGVGRSIHTPVGRAANREASVASMSEVVVSKIFDGSSLGAFKMAVGGTDTVKAQIDFVKVEGDKTDVYLTVKMENVLVSSYSASSGGQKPAESLSLNFSKVEYTYTEHDAKHKKGTSSTAGFDLATAKAL